jgi:hypothetical protein
MTVEDQAMTVYELYDKAIRGLDVTDRQRLVELIVHDLPETPSKPAIDFESKSMFDIIEEIGYIESTGPSDMARHPEKYMSGFGETKNRRKPTS